ncbi:MAG TPA: hypothetical protein VIS96_17695 [Terrimicrobiaceae bacterium]
MHFIETPIFTKQITELLDDSDYRRFQVILAYPKNKQEDLTNEQLKVLRTLVKEELS